MKRYVTGSFIALVVLGVAMAPLVTDAGNAGADAKRASVFAMRGDHATVSFGSETGGSIELRGRISDAAEDRPLTQLGIEVVRFEVEGEERVPDVSLEDLGHPPYATGVRIERVTASEGEFTLSDLEPGSYSLQVKWDQIPSGSNLVRWDLRWVERPARPERDR